MKVGRWLARRLLWLRPSYWAAVVAIHRAAVDWAIVLCVDPDGAPARKVWMAETKLLNAVQRVWNLRHLDS